VPLHAERGNGLHDPPHEMQTVAAASQGYARDVPMLPPHPDCASLRGCGAGYLVLLAQHCDKAAPWQRA
jgi:hypothetical protein